MGVMCRCLRSTGAASGGAPGGSGTSSASAAACRAYCSGTPDEDVDEDDDDNEDDDDDPVVLLLTVTLDKVLAVTANVPLKPEVENPATVTLDPTRNGVMLCGVKL